MTLIIAILLLLLVIYYDRTRSLYIIQGAPIRVPDAPFTVTNPPNFANVKEPIGELTSMMLENNIKVE
jgi:hypothetical protein